MADAACKLVVLEHRAPRSIRAARLTGSRVLVLQGSDGTLTTFGFLGAGGRLLDDASVCDFGPPQDTFARSVRACDTRWVPWRSRRQSARHSATDPSGRLCGARWSLAGRQGGVSALRRVVRTVVVLCANLCSQTATDSWETTGSVRRAVGFLAWFQAHTAS